MQELPEASQRELLMSLGAYKVVEPMLDLAYAESERWKWENQIGDDPHGRPWHVSFHACLTGDTEIVTRQGVKPIRELIGEAELLIPCEVANDSDSRSGRGQKTRSFRAGRFETVPVRSFGEHEVFDVHLRRGRQTKTVTATARHRWQLKDTSVVDTSELHAGAKLKSIKARRSQAQIVPFAVAQGFVFGDGTARRARRDTAWVDIHHNGKDEAMLGFFHGHFERNFQREGRLEVTQIQNLPRTWKKTPDMDESGPFLLSWLAGYFAADGSVSKSGQAVLTSASREAIDFVRGILSICGVGYGHVNVNVQSGTYPHGQEYTDKIMHNLTINVRDLPDWFFVLPKHAARARERLSKKPGHQHDWEVVSVVETGRLEEVFCPTTPTGFFALSDELLTGNSQFPGDASQSCPRSAVYGLADIPTEGPPDRWLVGVADVGKAVELSHVRAMRDAGYLTRSAIEGTSTDPESGLPQIGFIDKEHWLTGSVDMPILPLNYSTPHIVEVKSKHEKKIAEMQAGERGPDESHRRQLLCSLGLAAENPGAFMHPKEDVVLPAPVDGSIFYTARDSEWPGPQPTHEFFFEHDPGFMEQGREHLKRHRQAFIEGELVETVPHKNTRSHPLGWKWSEGACKYCPAKKACKSDYQNGINKLADSHAIALARFSRPGYDYETRRRRVFAFWGEDDPLA